MYADVVAGLLKRWVVLLLIYILGITVVFNLFEGSKGISMKYWGNTFKINVEDAFSKIPF